MSATIDVRDAVTQLTANMAGLKKQIDFASRVAVTRTAQLAAIDEQKEMRDVFRSPTPYTLNSLFVQPATKTRPSAMVKLKDEATKATPAAKFLAAQISGGQRKQKKFERALEAAGVMPVGYRAVPGSGAKVDAYGNMSRGQIVQILAFFRAFPEMGYKANMTTAGRAQMAKGTKKAAGFTYFVGRPGDRLPLGIYQRTRFAAGSAVRPVLIFVRSAVYQPTLDFEYVVEQTVKREFAGLFAKAFEEAMRTAR